MNNSHPQTSTPRALPVFEGWTVDVRLREFRRAEYGKELEFLPFATVRGTELLVRWEASEAATPRN